MTRVTSMVLLPVLACVAGCADTGGMQAQEQRVIQEADPDEVLMVAASILQREFGRVAVDRTARHITTTPVEFTTERESGTARDLYRGRSTMRRKAQMSVGRATGGAVARLQIDVERRDTARQTVTQPRGYRISDNPGAETPIDADAATTHEQSTVWTKVRRDRTLERALLDELREHFERLTAAAEGLEPVPPRSEQAEITAPAANARD